MSSDLLKKYSTEKTDQTELFSKEQVSEHLSQLGEQWGASSDEKKIIAEFEFKNFTEALEFVNRVGALAEQENHHPDISLHDYKNVRLSLSTHSIGGLSENDFILAAKIDGLV